MEQPPPRPTGPRPDRRRRLPKPVGLLGVAVVLVILVGGAVVGGRALLGGLGAVPDYAGPGTGTVLVRVHGGDSAADIGAMLAAKHVVRSEEAFRRAATAMPDSRSVQPGFYRLRERMRARLALGLLLDPTSRVRSRVVVPEGTPVTRILELVAEGSEVPLADLKAAAGNTAALGLPDYARGMLEGFLFPATYTVEPGTPAVDVLRMMVNRFQVAAAATDVVGGAAAVGRTPYEIVIIASMLEKEAGLPEDFPKVARVAYNRLARGMPLQFDSTLNYVLPERKGTLTIADTKIKSPYNTYQVTGLPPTPIDSPGEKALRAALNPEPGPWIYFVTIDKAGHTAFTDSYEEFLRLKKQGAAARG